MVKPNLFLNLILLFILFASCTQAEKKNIALQQIDERTKIKGYEVPQELIAKPRVVLAGKPKVVRALNPTIVKEKKHSTGNAEPSKSIAGVPQVCTPGQNGFSTPIRITATGVTFFSGNPEMVVAKDPSSKDINPHGFFSFGTIQGLKTNQIRSLHQDHHGNLWFSSDDGITRYDGKYLSHFVVSHGMYKNNIILSILEDQSGFLWFGTFGGGVLCFDGKKFTQYTKKEGLSNNIVNCIIQDRSGNFWMATSGGGVSKFDGKVFTHYTTKEGLASDQIRSIFQDNEGKIWFGTFGKGVSRFDGHSFSNYSEKEGFPATHIASIIQDKAGNMWFGSYKKGLIKYDGHFFYQYTDKQGLSNSNVLCMVQEDNGIIWVGSSGAGIFMFDGKIFNNYTEEDGLSNNFIRCSVIGKQGDLWFGTRDGGLVRYRKNLFNHYTDNEGLGASKVLSIIPDKKGNLWFGSFGGGITRYDGKEFAAYSLNESLLNKYVYTLLEDDDGAIWIGSDGGGITRFDGKYFSQYTQNEGLCNNSIRCIIKDRNHYLWIGSYGGGVSKFDGKSFVNYSEKEGLSSSKILCMLEEKNGVLWFGTDGGGVTRFDGKKFTHFSAKESLKSNTVTSMLQDNKGDLWFGSSGGGVTRYDGKTFTFYTKKEGLSNNYITSLLQDKKSDIWIGTSLGPNMLKTDQLRISSEKSKSLIFKNFSYEDGFLGIGCNLNALFEDKNSTLWVGSTNRLTAIRPNEEVPDTVPPNIKLINIQLYNENIPWIKIESNKDTSFVLENGVRVGDFKFTAISKWYFLPENLSLAYNNNFLTFSFIGISQKQTPKIRYQYQLEGFDSHWSAPTYLTEISYGNLRPGKYLFKVKAMNSEGVWSQESRYSFAIRYPWWKTGWFYSLLIIGIVALIISYIKWREHKHKLHEKLLNKKIEEQTYELIEKNREFEKKNVELQIANSEKDKFFSIIAHDVRGPLSTFLSFTEMIAENIQSYDKNEIQTMTASMKESAASLFKLLENLLEWARMQRGLIQYNPERFNLIEVFNDSLETTYQSAKNKSINLYVEIPSDMEVVADRNMLSVIFRNLTSNAIKFTPKGGEVIIKARKSENSLVEISVIDTGIGMEEQILNGLFKIDVHNNRKGTDGEMSIGLGLLLCKDFVEKQKGSIWVESEPGKGSTFYFTLHS